MGQAKHIHNWEKVSGDETGSIIMCVEKDCEEMAFLPGEDAKKFDELKATQTSVDIELIDPLKSKV